MKQIIEGTVSRIVSIKAALDDSKIHDSAETSLSSLSSFIEKHGVDTALGLRLTSLLQLSNEEKDYSQFELEDIEKLFDALIALEPYNVDLYIEAAQFSDAILGDSAKAVSRLTVAQSIISAKQNELDRLKENIRGDGLEASA